jgi:hypothetical protein
MVSRGRCRVVVCPSQLRSEQVSIVKEGKNERRNVRMKSLKEAKER